MNTKLRQVVTYSLPQPMPTKIEVFTMMMRALFITISLTTILVGCGQSGMDAKDATQRLSILGRDIIHGQEVVTPEMLADWLIKEKQDFVLLDIRSQKAFQTDHIPEAKNVPLTYLFEEGNIEKLPENRMIVLYSDATRKAAAATAVLRLAGRHAYFLEQGYAGWQDRILHPRQISGEDDNEVQKRIAISCYFAGNYKADSNAGFTPPVLPLQPAVAPTSKVPDKVQRQRRKLKAEGC